jgi:hypothetical protein
MTSRRSPAFIPRSDCCQPKGLIECNAQLTGVATKQAYPQNKVQHSGAAPRILLRQEAPLISAGRNFVLVGPSSAGRRIPWSKLVE